MNPCFFSLEMLVRKTTVWCGDDTCPTCDGLSQQLYNLAREENR